MAFHDARPYGNLPPRRNRQTSRNSRRNSGRIFGPVILILFALFITAIIAFVAIYKNSASYVTATVRDKERVCSSTSKGSDCKYLIFTDHGTFKDTDSFLYGKFNSSDVYGEIVRGNTYRFKVVGWRIPIFSSYKNIVKVENGTGSN